MSGLLRWVGSKRWIRHRIAKLVQDHLASDGQYWEPFAGSASVLFTIQDIHSACICDTIEPLIRTFKAIKEEPYDVWYWSNYFAKSGIENYYEMRNLFNRMLLGKEELNSEQQFAGMFIYLNNTCFNGLWRQNELGEFNVPVSDKQKVTIPKQRLFYLTSQTLQYTDIILVEPPTDIFEIVSKANRGDVVFSDPPYYGTFNGYDGIDLSEDGFHERLSETMKELVSRGVYVISMNSNEKFIRNLYQQWCSIETIERYQSISSTPDGRGEWKQIMVVPK